MDGLFGTEPFHKEYTQEIPSAICVSLCQAWCSAIPVSAAKDANQGSMDHTHTSRDGVQQVYLVLTLSTYFICPPPPTPLPLHPYILPEPSYINGLGKVSKVLPLPLGTVFS